MSKWRGAVLCALLACGPAEARSPKPAPTFPDQFLIGRRMYFDFGPPFEFYEIFSIRSDARGALVERIALAPAGNACTQPATFQIATASISESVATLLSGKNPCMIPEKELRREQKRCKNCVVFSGADVTMQAQCGGQSRRIRMDVLDRDLFDKATKTPEHTSWTIMLLDRLDQALNKKVADRPAFATQTEPILPAADLGTGALTKELSEGVFDALFEKASLKPSSLYKDSKNIPLQPSVELLSSSPFRPESYAMPEYTPLARAARQAGQVVLTLNINQNERAFNLRFLSGPIMLQKAVELVAFGWTFPKESVGEEIRIVFDFKLNCPTQPQ